MEKVLPNAALIRTSNTAYMYLSVQLGFCVSVFSEECISFADAVQRVDDTHFCHNGIQY